MKNAGIITILPVALFSRTGISCGCMIVKLSWSLLFLALILMGCGRVYTPATSPFAPETPSPPTVKATPLISLSEVEVSSENGTGWWVVQQVAAEAGSGLWYWVPAGNLPDEASLLPLPACPDTTASATPPPDAPPGFGKNKRPEILQVLWVAPHRFVYLCISPHHNGWCPPEASCAFLWDRQKGLRHSAAFYARNLFSRVWLARYGEDTWIAFPCLSQDGSWGVCESRFGTPDVRFLFSLENAEILARHPERPLFALREPVSNCDMYGSAREGFRLVFVNGETRERRTWTGFEKALGRSPTCAPKATGTLQGWFRWEFVGWNPRNPDEFAVLVFLYPENTPADRPLDELRARKVLLLAQPEVRSQIPLPDGLHCSLWAPKGNGFLCREENPPFAYVWLDRQGNLRQRWPMPEEFRVVQWAGNASR